MVNVTNHFEGITDMKGLFGVANATTGGFAWISLLFMEQAIMFLALLRFGFNAALLSSAFIALISGVFLVYLELVSWTHLMVFLGQILFMIIYITWQQRE